MEKLRVGAYGRVSTDKADQVNSLESQRKYFKDYIQAHENWSLVNIYYDEGISGTQTKNRAGFNRMIDDALHGQVDLILTKEVSRFARNTVDTLSYTRKLKAAGVGVVFTIDNIDTRDCDGELRLTIMASIAQEESRKTSERVKWGQKRRMEQGVVFGRDLMGYTVKNGELFINEEEVEVVRAIFYKFTEEGKGTTVIARELLEEGLRPKRIQRWSNTVILRALRNEKYVGDLCQKKTITPDYLTHGKKYNHGEEEMVYIRDHHQPIIDRELWERTQAELERKAPTAEQKLKHCNRYWCSGKLFCGLCGSRYVSRTHRLKDGTQYKAWRCHEAAYFGRRKEKRGEIVGCDNSYINDRALLSCMKYVIGNIKVNYASLRDEIINEIKAIQGTSLCESNRIHKRIEELRGKKRKMIDLALEGALSKEDLHDQSAWYDEQILDLEEILRNTEQEELTRDRQVTATEGFIKALDEIMHFDEDNREVYRNVLDRMVISGNIVDIYLKRVPFAARLTIRSFGRGASYSTEVLNMEILNKQ